MKAAILAAALLGFDIFTSCLAFLLPTARVVSRTRSPGGRGLKVHLPSSLGRHAELGHSGSGSGSRFISSSSSSNTNSGSTYSRRVAHRRSCFELRAAEGADGGGFGGSVDIFDALTAGDMAFVTEYVQGGGDCSVQDSIGEERGVVQVSWLTQQYLALIRH